MNIVKRKKNKNYTTISNVCVRDDRLSMQAKGLMCLVMSLPDDWDFSIPGLLSITKERQSAVYSAINELKKYGYCELKTIRDKKGKITGKDYVFYEEPPHQENPHQENPYQENQDMDNQDMDNQDMENPHQENPYQENQDMDNQDMDNQDMENPHQENPYQENQPQINKDIIKKEEINKRFNKEKDREKEIGAVAPTPKKTLEERERIFREEADKYRQTYGDRIIDEFLTYWTEPTPGRKRMRFEGEKTWEMARRISTWFKNDKKFNHGKSNDPDAARERREQEIATLMQKYMGGIS